jgi:hypothetical protein
VVANLLCFEPNVTLCPLIQTGEEVRTVKAGKRSTVDQLIVTSVLETGLFKALSHRCGNGVTVAELGLPFRKRPLARAKTAYK